MQTAYLSERIWKKFRIVIFTTYRLYYSPCVKQPFPVALPIIKRTCLFLFYNFKAYFYIEGEVVKGKFHFFRKINCCISDIDFVLSQVNTLIIQLKNGKNYSKALYKPKKMWYISRECGFFALGLARFSGHTGVFYPISPTVCQVCPEKIFLRKVKRHA